MNNALQAIGNKNKPTRITDPAYLRAKKLMEETFNTVRLLKPDATLLQWTSVSKIPAGPLEDVINNIKTNDQRLPIPSSPETICTLTRECRAFQQARKTFLNIASSLQQR